jgi:hypothetical protein
MDSAALGHGATTGQTEGILMGPQGDAGVAAMKSALAVIDLPKSGR